jgi:hypothetical protein
MQRKLHFFIYVPDCSKAMMLLLRRTLVRSINYGAF